MTAEHSARVSRRSDAWALRDAGVAGFENANQAAGATFYGAVCALYPTTFLDAIAILNPPNPPPSPVPPFSDQVSPDTVISIRPKRIFFSGGWDAAETGVSSTTQSGSLAEMIDVENSEEIIDRCTDDADTVCQTLGTDRSWIKFDLGSPFHVKAVEVILLQHARDPPSPPPPSTPPDPPPSTRCSSRTRLLA